MAKTFASCCFLFISMSLAFVAGGCEPAVPAVFILGDSILDVGTNDFLPAVSPVAKANFRFNGIDYPHSVPTGRFSNGYNTADEIVKLLGFEESPPPFLALLNDSSTVQKNLLKGANFASGGSGILNKTGQIFFNFMSLGEQVNLFSTALGNITDLIGPSKSFSLMSKSLFLISSGSNDVFEQQQNGAPINGDFLANLQSTYGDHLTDLYNLGARKFGIMSIPPLGCCPVENGHHGGACVPEANDFARQFYNATDFLLQKLSTELPGFNYSLGNSFALTNDLIANPLAFGIKDTKSACCGNATTPCNPNASHCKNREEHLFWDRFHPTQKTARLAALTFYGASNKFVKPVNFSTLAAINIV